MAVMNVDRHAQEPFATITVPNNDQQNTHTRTEPSLFSPIEAVKLNPANWSLMSVRNRTRMALAVDMTGYGAVSPQ